MHGFFSIFLDSAQIGTGVLRKKCNVTIYTDRLIDIARQNIYLFYIHIKLKLLRIMLYRERMRGKREFTESRYILKEYKS